MAEWICSVSVSVQRGRTNIRIFHASTCDRVHSSSATSVDRRLDPVKMPTRRSRLSMCWSTRTCIGIRSFFETRKQHRRPPRTRWTLSRQTVFPVPARRRHTCGRSPGRHSKFPLRATSLLLKEARSSLQMQLRLRYSRFEDDRCTHTRPR